MKGPGLRTRLDVRRLWKCPQTGKTLKTSGRVTQMVSPFARPECFMDLVEEYNPARVQPPLEEILAHMQIPPAPEETPAIAPPAPTGDETQPPTA